MGAARTVLLFDSLLGIGWIVTGVSVSAPKMVAGVWWLVGIAGPAAVGVLGYRLVYGLVRPIPDGRLERARQRGV